MLRAAQLCVSAGVIVAASLPAVSCQENTASLSIGESTVATQPPARREPATDYAFAAFSVSRVGAPVPGVVSDPTIYMPQVSLRQIVETAYRVTRARTEGGPSWMDDPSWRVAGRASDPTSPYWAAREMLKRVLADSFQLRAEFTPRRTRRVVLSLDRTRKRSGIRPAASDIDCRPFLDDVSHPSDRPKSAEGWPICGISYLGSSPHRVHLRSAPLELLALTLERVLGTVVVVERASAELFDIDFLYPRQYRPGAGEPEIDAFADALEAQLGIGIAVSAASVDVLEIEGAARPGDPPLAN